MLRPRRWLRRVLLAASLVAPVLLGGCSGASEGGGVGPDPSAGSPAERALVASKLATLAVTVATGPRGRSFFDNFLPCPRRGVVDYRDASGARQATVTGCDLGDGVVVDGTAALRWVGAAPSFEQGTPARLELTGQLTAHVGAPGGGSTAIAVERLGVDGIAFEAGTDPSSSGERNAGWPVLAGLRLTALRAALGGAPTGQAGPVDDRAAPARVFGAEELTIATLPAPAGGPAGLSEADVKRLAYHLGVQLAAVLFNETLEYQRGPHAHELECGSFRVLQDTARRLPRLEYTWRACPLGGGLFVDGTFTQAWAADADLRAGLMRTVVEGTLTVGGGVPQTTLTRFEWNLTMPATLPGPGRIAGRLVAAGGGRPFTFDLVLDD